MRVIARKRSILRRSYLEGVKMLLVIVTGYMEFYMFRVVVRLKKVILEDILET